MTQIESKPASSASRTIRASVGPMASAPPGHVNEGICRPTFIGPERTGYRVWLPSGDGDLGDGKTLFPSLA